MLFPYMLSIMLDFFLPPELRIAELFSPNQQFTMTAWLQDHSKNFLSFLNQQVEEGEDEEGTVSIEGVMRVL